MAVTIKLNRAELIAIANQVNTEVCMPIAERVAVTVRESAPEGHPDMAKFVHVGTEPRSAWAHDYAHATVVNNYPGALKLESRLGLMAQALGSA